MTSLTEFPLGLAALRIAALHIHTGECYGSDLTLTCGIAGFSFEEFAERYALLDDGMTLVERETGEMAEIIRPLVEGEPFRVTNADSADWVLEKMAQVAAEIEADKMQLAAVAERIGKRMAQKQQRLEGLHQHFDIELREFAAAEMLRAGGKRKSVSLTWATLSLRNVAGGAISVIDGKKDDALAWAKANVPDAVKISESVVVTPLKPFAADLPDDLFTVSEPREAFDIKFGITKGSE